jgi:hypothetical protein
MGETTRENTAEHALSIVGRVMGNWAKMAANAYQLL